MLCYVMLCQELQFLHRAVSHYPVHDVRPAFHRHALEHGQHRKAEVVETGDAVVRTFPTFSALQILANVSAVQPATAGTDWLHSDLTYVSYRRNFNNAEVSRVALAEDTKISFRLRYHTTFTTLLLSRGVDHEGRDATPTSYKKAIKLTELHKFNCSFSQRFPGRRPQGQKMSNTPATPAQEDIECFTALIYAPIDL